MAKKIKMITWCVRDENGILRAMQATREHAEKYMQPDWFLYPEEAEVGPDSVLYEAFLRSKEI